MRTLRMFLAGMVMLALLGLSAAVAAQSEVEPAVWVTGTDVDCSIEVGPEVSTDGEVQSYRGMGLVCTAEMSDPRLSGVATKVYNEDCFSQWPCVYWGTHEIAGPEGTWVGHYAGTHDPEQQANSYFAYSGTGAYDGLSFVGRAVAASGEPATVEGVIYAGDPPPMGAPSK
jgi:hypothetical protein